ncbi:MAG: [FeFe] hydrogenase H-cluster maturation GTPase HydF [Bacteroidales bacterium]|nr:[FeFe] hydrogenase H-cluster maturation GTPase HydF [Bacteroidales bacterium]MCF8399667.1 [FeFe] hydrogenase H-cluster maturation GTPase HydF [Bacteroidales bacterium]
MSKGKDNKPHIGIFGRRNNGKSSFINAITGQEIAIVSEQAGTTTDPVKKSIEIFGIGPAIIVDTAGIDDTGDLGEKRIKKSLDVIKTIDMAILMITSNTFGKFEEDLIKQFRDFEVPYFLVHNKSDLESLIPARQKEIQKAAGSDIIEFSAVKPDKLDDIIDLMRETIPETAYQMTSLMGDLLSPGDVVLLITPIDSEAPDGRMILPQVMAIRDVLDNDCICVTVKESQLEQFIKTSNLKPALAVTDSQAFEFVSSIVPEEIPLTSFSILFARMRGAFDKYIEGTLSISHLEENNRILILESCTHRVSCDDIGRFKIPGWIEKFTGKKVDHDVVAGLNNLPRPIQDYKLVIQCGGCVITRKQILGRLKPAIDAGIPVTNYGMAIAYMHGIFDRAVAPFYKYD